MVDSQQHTKSLDICLVYWNTPTSAEKVGQPSNRSPQDHAAYYVHETGNNQDDDEQRGIDTTKQVLATTWWQVVTTKELQIPQLDYQNREGLLVYYNANREELANKILNESRCRDN